MGWYGLAPSFSVLLFQSLSPETRKRAVLSLLTFTKKSIIPLEVMLDPFLDFITEAEAPCSECRGMVRDRAWLRFEAFRPPHFVCLYRLLNAHSASFSCQGKQVKGNGDLVLDPRTHPSFLGASPRTLEMVRFLDENGHDWDQDSIDNLFAGGSLEGLQYLHDKGVEFGHSFYQGIFDNNHSHILVWLRMIDYPLPTSDEASFIWNDVISEDDATYLRGMISLIGLPPESLFLFFAADSPRCFAALVERGIPVSPVMWLVSIYQGHAGTPQLLLDRGVRRPDPTLDGLGLFETVRDALPDSINEVLADVIAELSLVWFFADELWSPSLWASFDGNLDALKWVHEVMGVRFGPLALTCAIMAEANDETLRYIVEHGVGMIGMSLAYLLLAFGDVNKLDSLRRLGIPWHPLTCFQLKGVISRGNDEYAARARVLLKKCVELGCPVSAGQRLLLTM